MGDIKGRACINGAPQRAYIPKEDAASPTVSTDSTFVTTTIAAKERRKVRCYDVPSAFVNTDVDEDVRTEQLRKLGNVLFLPRPF